MWLVLMRIIGVEGKGEKGNDKGKKLDKFVVVDMDGGSS